MRILLFSWNSNAGVLLRCGELVGCGAKAERAEENGTYTWTSLTSTLALGVRGEMTSVHAIKAATTNATVVKNPKTFWMRTTDECMLAQVVLRPIGRYYMCGQSPLLHAPSSCESEM